TAVFIYNQLGNCLYDLPQGCITRGDGSGIDDQNAVLFIGKRNMPMPKDNNIGTGAFGLVEIALRADCRDARGHFLRTVGVMAVPQQEATAVYRNKLLVG